MYLEKMRNVVRWLFSPILNNEEYCRMENERKQYGWKFIMSFHFLSLECYPPRTALEDEIQSKSFSCLMPPFHVLSHVPPHQPAKDKHKENLFSNKHFPLVHIHSASSHRSSASCPLRNAKNTTYNIMFHESWKFQSFTLNFPSFSSSFSPPPHIRLARCRGRIKMCVAKFLNHFRAPELEHESKFTHQATISRCY